MTCSVRESILHVCLEESCWCICCADFSNFYIWDYHRFWVCCSFWKTEFHSVTAVACVPRGSVREGKCINEMRDRQCYLNHLNSITWGLTQALCCFPDQLSYPSANQTKLNHNSAKLKTTNLSQKKVKRSSTESEGTDTSNQIKMIKKNINHTQWSAAPLHQTQ